MKVINVETLEHVLKAYVPVARSDEAWALIKEGIDRNAIEITDEKPHQVKQPESSLFVRDFDKAPESARVDKMPMQGYIKLEDAARTLLQYEELSARQAGSLITKLMNYKIETKDLQRLAKATLLVDKAEAAGLIPEPVIGRFQYLFLKGFAHVKSIVMARAAQYTDTYAFPEHRAFAALTQSTGMPRHPVTEQKRVLATQLDIKFARLEGGFKSDTFYDLGAFALAIAGLVREEEEAHEAHITRQKQQPQLPLDAGMQSRPPEA